MYLSEVSKNKFVRRVLKYVGNKLRWVQHFCITTTYNYRNFEILVFFSGYYWRTNH